MAQVLSLDDETGIPLDMLKMLPLEVESKTHHRCQTERDTMGLLKGMTIPLYWLHYLNTKE